MVGSAFTTQSIPTWYAALHKPIFNPPNWIFAPVWTLLYILMGTAMGMIASAKTKINKLSAYQLFIAQLVLNTVWSIIFFGLRAPLWAFVEIVFLYISIWATFITFKKISNTAAYLLIPYILWVSFASVLNLFIFLLN